MSRLCLVLLLLCCARAGSAQQRNSRTRQSRDMQLLHGHESARMMLRRKRDRRGNLASAYQVGGEKRSDTPPR
ncbi:hypothetical protein CDO47_35695 [Pseudomonas aeruginosa]|nr:hypothetical protein CDO47_35695 [Pseudomonas aeruginosa]